MQVQDEQTNERKVEQDADDKVKNDTADEEQQKSEQAEQEKRPIVSDCGEDQNGSQQH